MDKDKELTKLVNMLSRTARMALNVEWTEDTTDAAQYCVEQYNRVLERLKQLDPNETTVFEPLESGSSLNVVAIASRQLAAYYEDEVTDSNAWQTFCGGAATSADAFKDFWRKGASDVQDLGEAIRESIETWSKQRKNRDSESSEPQTDTGPQTDTDKSKPQTDTDKSKPQD